MRCTIGHWVRTCILPDFIFPEFIRTQIALECRIWPGPTLVKWKYQTNRRNRRCPTRIEELYMPLLNDKIVMKIILKMQTKISKKTITIHQNSSKSENGITLIDFS